MAKPIDMSGKKYGKWTVNELAYTKGLKPSTLYQRIVILGWPVEEALERKVRSVGT